MPAAASADTASSRRDRTLAAASSKHTTAASTILGASGLKPTILQRQDWHLIEEARQQPLSECFTYNEFPFLWSLAAQRSARIALSLRMHTRRSCSHFSSVRVSIFSLV
jgi:hypothetical protein